MPLCYDQWMVDPTKHMVCCTDGDDRVLGVDTVGVYDGGDTVMFQALRVHPKWQRCGVAKQLSVGCAEQIAALHVQPKRVRVTTNSGNNTSIRLHYKLGFRPLVCFGLYGCNFDAKGGGAVSGAAAGLGGNRDGGGAVSAATGAVHLAVEADQNTSSHAAAAAAAAAGPRAAVDQGAASKTPSLASAAELWGYLSGGGWEWTGCEGGGTGTNSIFTDAGSGGGAGGAGGCEGGGYSGGLPLLSVDWVVMECTLETLLMLEEKYAAQYAVVLRPHPAVLGRSTSGSGGSAVEEHAHSTATVPAVEVLESFSVGLESSRVSGSHFYAHIYTGNNVGSSAGAGLGAGAGAGAGPGPGSGAAAAAAGEGARSHSVKRCEHAAFWSGVAKARLSINYVIVYDHSPDNLVYTAEGGAVGSGGGGAVGGVEGATGGIAEGSERWCLRQAVGAGFAGDMPFYIGGQVVLEKRH